METIKHFHFPEMPFLLGCIKTQDVTGEDVWVSEVEVDDHNGASTAIDESLWWENMVIATYPDEQSGLMEEARVVSVELAKQRNSGTMWVRLVLSKLRYWALAQANGFNAIDEL